MFWNVLRDWLRAALTNARAIKRLRMPPVWLALTVVLTDFVLVWLCFRYTRRFSLMGCAVSGVVLCLARLSLASFVVGWTCSYLQVSPETLGIRLSRLAADLRWSFKLCAVGGSVVGAVLAAGFFAALGLGLRLPPPPELFVQVMGSSRTLPSSVAVAVLGVLILVVLAPLTEELIYRSLLFPILAFRLGLFPAVAASSVVFGLLHTLPFGEAGIGWLQVLGGLMMATAFAVRWSVTPALLVHATGNLFVGTVAVLYVQLYEKSPALFFR